MENRLADVGYPVDIAGNTAVSVTGFIFVIAPSTGLWQYNGKQTAGVFVRTAVL